MAKSRGSRILLVLLYLAVALVYLSGIWTAPRHEGDEATWIALSYHLEDYLSLRFDEARWSNSTWINANAPLTFYLAGVGRNLGGYAPADLNQPWRYGRTVEFNTRQGNRPSDRLLRWARLPFALLAVAAVCLTHQVVCTCAGGLAGLLWLMLALASAYLRVQLVRAMCEAPLLLFVALAMLLTGHALSRAQRPGWLTARRIRTIAALYGLLSGLAGSAKLNGLGIAAAGVVLLALLVWLLPGQPARRGWLLVSVVGLLAGVAGVVLVALNPYYWPSPVARVLQSLPNRLALMERVGRIESDELFASWSQRLRTVPLRVLQTYAAISDAGARLTVLPLNAVLSLLGLVVLGHQALAGARRKVWNPSALAILLVGAPMALPALLTPLDWDRYYLLPVYFATIAIAVGLAWVARRLRRPDEAPAE